MLKCYSVMDSITLLKDGNTLVPSLESKNTCAIVKMDHKKNAGPMPPATKNQNPEQIVRDQIDAKLADEHFCAAHGGTQ